MDIIFGKFSFLRLFSRIFASYSIIDLTGNIKSTPVDLDEIIRLNRVNFISVVTDYLETLNIKNSNVEWLAYNVSAKNPLSSPFIGRILKVLACIELINNNPKTKFIIYGASAAQRLTIKKALKIRCSFLLFYYAGLLKKTILVVWEAYKYLKSIKKNFLINKPNKVTADIAIMTYVDGSNRKTSDPYFGNLIDEIALHEPGLKAIYLLYVSPPFKERMEELVNVETHNFALAFSFLTVDDLKWIVSTIKKSLINPEYDIDGFFAGGFSPKLILKEVLLEDTRGGYMNNLIMYKVGCNIKNSQSFKKIIYPFENKALEKCLLIGLNGRIKTIGYQHSSITPRHFSFLMDKEEIKLTPLPDQIITSGTITSDWLINRGNFPAEKITNGFSLRYKLEFSDGIKDFSPKSPKLFLALSSSHEELENGVIFLQKLKRLNPEYILRLRTHINFPLHILSPELLEWVADNVEVPQSTLLKENFEWADITLYISSTVALESLMFGVPVIRLDIDCLDSDPLLNNIPNKWVISSASACQDAVKEIANLSADEKISRAKESIEYINSYFNPQNENSYRLFLN